MTRLSEEELSLSSGFLPEIAEIKLYHSMEFCAEKYKSASAKGRNRTITKACRECRNGGEERSKKLSSRTPYYCVECSIVSINRVYLHPQCFARYHNKLDELKRKAKK